MKHIINKILFLLIIVNKSFTSEEAKDKKLIYFISFDLFVNDFINFEPKTGLIEMDLSIKYKWWNNNTQQNRLALDQHNDNKVRKNIETHSFYPVIKFDKDKLVKLTVKNQVHRVDNLEEVKPIISRMKLNSKKFYRQYSSLEQHFLIKFNCQTTSSNDDPNKFLNFFNIISTNSLDSSMEKFPFDSHECQLVFSLIPRQFNMNNLAQQLRINKEQPSYSFLISNNLQQNENNYLNKLVETSNNYSFIKREWLLKKYTITYSNNNTNDKISINFHIFRRREPQIFIFILPLVIFTILTFMIFFMSTTTSACEKSLISFLNLIFLLAFNIYLFKLMIFVYELVRIPMILQYSNCLMIIQLGVFVYVVLAKSLYYTINSSLLTQATKSTWSYLSSNSSSSSSTATINSLNQFIENSNNSQNKVKLRMPIIKLGRNSTYSKESSNSYTSMFVPPFTINNNIDTHVGSVRHNLMMNCETTETDCDFDLYSSKKLIDDRLSIPVDGSWIMNKSHYSNNNNNNKKDSKQIYFINENNNNNNRPNNYQVVPTTKSNEIARLSLNVKKLVKFEELNLKEKLIRSEWSKKARLCDILCFLLAFFLLSICSLLIFFIFPSEYFKYTNNF